MAVDFPAIDEIDVLITVAVEIGHADPRAEDLAVYGDPFVSTKMDEVNPGCFSDIRELDGAGLGILGLCLSRASGQH